VTEPAGLTGYDRDCGRGHSCVFGQRWSDDMTVAFGHNGCDTRNDVLARDFEPASIVRRGPCKVVGGTLHDPYTGATLTFDPTHPDAIQIDHVVALAAAWRTGAAGWSLERRRDFANDPRNLLAVAGHEQSDQGRGHHRRLDAPAGIRLQLRPHHRHHQERIPPCGEFTGKTALRHALSTCDTGGG
jgi:hypothetical protein